MRAIRHIFSILRTDEKAATAIEYGLIVSLVVIAIIAALTTFSGASIGMWNNVSTRIVGATTTS